MRQDVYHEKCVREHGRKFIFFREHQHDSSDHVARRSRDDRRKVGETHQRTLYSAEWYFVIIFFSTFEKSSTRILFLKTCTPLKNFFYICTQRKKKKKRYRWIPGKTMAVFLDDIHMPIKETCGAQPPLELMRQWVDYGFWYDRKKQCQKNVKNMLLVCSTAVFDRVKRSISDRIMSCFSVVHMTTPRDNDIHKIYETILGRHLTNFDETVFELGTYTRYFEILGSYWRKTLRSYTQYQFYKHFMYHQKKMIIIIL